jgi:tetratricopeptide (TPR) repeat protein
VPASEQQSPSGTATEASGPYAAGDIASLGATEAYTAFRTAFDAGKYLEAVAPAQRVLTLAEQSSKDAAAEDIQVAVMNLAMTQYLADDYVGAEESYKRAIKLITDSGRPLHQRLARAYAGLATTYHDGERHDLAVKNYEQAVALVRRSEGLMTEQQVPIIQKYIDSLTQLGRYNDALQAQRYVLRIATRKYGDNDARLAPTLEQIGRWLMQVGAYDQSRRTLKRAMDLVETAEGDKSPKLVNLLMALAACARKQMLDPAMTPVTSPDAERSTVMQDPGMPGTTYSPATLWAEGERALTRAVAIAESRPDPVAAQVADARTQLGDWYQARGQPDKALSHYQQAWAAATQVLQKYAGKTLAEALFGKPVLLQIVPPDSWNKYSQRPRDQIEVRHVEVQFTVTPDGKTGDWKVNDDSGDRKRAERTIDSLRAARYRPRLDKGQPVTAAGVLYTQPWIVLLDAPAATDSKPPDAKPAPAEAAKKTAATSDVAPAPSSSRHEPKTTN